MRDENIYLPSMTILPSGDIVSIPPGSNREEHESFLGALIQRAISKKKAKAVASAQAAADQAEEELALEEAEAARRAASIRAASNQAETLLMQKKQESEKSSKNLLIYGGIGFGAVLMIIGVIFLVKKKK